MLDINFIKKIGKIAWPISLQSILVTLLGMIDIVMVSHLGDSAVASVGISNRIFFVVLIIMTGIASGVGVLSAQYYGAAQVEKIKSIVAMAIVFSSIVLIPIVALNYYFAADIITLASSDNVVVVLGES